MKQATKLLYLSPENLITHPKNLRRFYPEEQVREMAESIKAGRGVKQALQIVPNGKAGRFFVVDGNMRLAGARLLGKDCPPLKCELLDANAAEQFLTMLVTAKFRYDPDPISEALHYKRLMDEEGYKVPQIAQATGVAATAIYQRMKLLELDKEIQELIAIGKLPADKRAAEAFLSIPDPKPRVMLAKRVSRDGMTIKSIQAACERLNTQLKEIPAVPDAIAPALVVGTHRAFGKKVKPDTKIKIDVVRDAAKAMCEKCDIKASSIGGAEPAWSLIAHAAEEVCGTCDVRKVKNSCGSCPGVDLVRRIVLGAGERA